MRMQHQGLSARVKHAQATDASLASKTRLRVSGVTPASNTMTLCFKPLRRTAA